jgi:kynurenine formamidase
VHEMYPKSRNLWDDRVDGLHPQGSTQWDGFRHVRAREFGFFGGVTDDPPAMGDRLGIDRWAERGIIGRGVLVDVARHLAATEPGWHPLAPRAVGADELRAIAAAPGAEVREGDILVLRFGWTAAWEALPATERAALAADSAAMTFTGLRATADVAELLWDWGVAAVAADNPGLEVSPGDPADGNLHRRCIPLLGIPFGELFQLDELAARVADDGRPAFFLSSVPLRLARGVGSPANAVAIR